VHLLNAIGAAVPGVHLKLICDRPLALGKLPIEFVPWSERTEAAEIASSSIGISWMPDDDWSRGKCGLKVLQYMAAGLPVVANPVGVHVDMVRHDETGFLAETAGEWVAAIRKLAANPTLRARMGMAGRRLVARDYRVSIGAEKWLAVLADLEFARSQSA
jgi:glycosyltransferase involved in cell wall biosynthesis